MKSTGGWWQNQPTSQLPPTSHHNSPPLKNFNSTLPTTLFLYVPKFAPPGTHLLGIKVSSFSLKNLTFFYKWAERARYTLWLRSLGTTTARTVGLSLRARYHYRNWADGFLVDYCFEIFCCWVVKHRLYLIFLMNRFLIPIYVLACVAVCTFRWEKSFNPLPRSLFDLHLGDFWWCDWFSNMIDQLFPFSLWFL